MNPTLPIELRYLEGTDNRRLDAVVVIPVARCEWHLAVKLLKWMDCLRDSPTLIVYCSPGVSESERAAFGEITDCTVVHATHFRDTGYFGGANNMVKGALDYVEKHHPGKAMLYIEADAVPIRSGWFDAILDEYRGCGQPIGADVHLCEINHATGNAMYHPEWRTLMPSLAQLPGPDPEWGWDSQCADDTFTRCHRMRTIQQIWRPSLPITSAWVANNIRSETMLFHQCKDGSLIDVLTDRMGIERIALPERLEESSYAKGRKTPDTFHSSRLRSPMARMIAGFPMQPQVGPVEILIVTYAKDMEFLRYCLKSIEKFATGFAGLTIVVPEHERGKYDWVKKAKVCYFEERSGKGMLHHEVQICRADEWCPNAWAVLHLDTDCIMWRKCSPADFFSGIKPILYRERYAELRNPNRKLWQKAVEDAAGFKPEYETMVRHPAVHLRDVYPALRKAVESHTGVAFDDYVLSGRNDFPQSFAEFPALGAIAIRDFRDRYEMVDYVWRRDARECGLPADTSFQYIYRRERDAVAETWSHGGIGRYKSDIEGWLAGRVPQYWVK